MGYAGKYTGGSQDASESGGDASLDTSESGASGQTDAYQNYLHQYTEGSQDSASPLELSEKSEKKSSEGHARRLQEVKSKKPQGNNYQQYMNQYAGGQGGGS